LAHDRHLPDGRGPRTLGRQQVEPELGCAQPFHRGRQRGRDRRRRQSDPDHLRARTPRRHLHSRQFPGALDDDPTHGGLSAIMLQPPPAEPGAPIDEVDTPALLIDLDALERNLDHMAALAREAGVKLRPHAKTHKSPVIARLQMARGAVGQCVQKVAEAEVLAWGGVGDILVSNEVAGPRKLARFAALSRISTAAICVDSEAGVAALEAAAEDAGLRLTALIESDVGMDRCGIPPGPAVTALAQRIAASRWLRFGGLQAYQGGAQHQRTPDERRASIARAVAPTGGKVGGPKAASLN